MLDNFSKLKGEPRKVKNKVVEIQMHAHNGSGFCIWNKLNYLRYERRTVDLIKKEKA